MKSFETLCDDPLLVRWALFADFAGDTLALLQIILFYTEETSRKKVWEDDPNLICFNEHDSSNVILPQGVSGT